jgi:hypothetical protein
MKTDKFLRLGVWTIAAILGLLLVQPALQSKANPPGKVEYLVLDLSDTGRLRLEKDLQKAIQEEIKRLNMEDVMAPVDKPRPSGGDLKGYTNQRVYQMILTYYGNQGWGLVSFGTFTVFKR